MVEGNQLRVNESGRDARAPGRGWLVSQDWKTFEVVHLDQFDVGGLAGEFSLYGLHVGGTGDGRVPVVVMA